MRKYIGGGDFDGGVNRKIKTPLIAKKKHQYRQPGESSLVSPIDTVFYGGHDSLLYLATRDPF